MIAINKYQTSLNNEDAGTTQKTNNKTHLTTMNLLKLQDSWKADCSD